MDKLFHQQKIFGPNSHGTCDFACSLYTFEIPHIGRRVMLSSLNWSSRSKFFKIWCCATPLKNKEIKGRRLIPG